MSPLVPGVYCFASSAGLTGTLTLTGTASDVWVFKTVSTLITGPGSSVVMSGGGQNCNVFWQVGSSATLDTTTQFIGTILAHTSISLRHAEAQRWCLDCHEGDRLRLPNGELVDYERSYVLCGQCHGTVFRDWKVGIHGTRTGAWNGEQYYRVCVSCHDAHQPRFKAIEPKPAPIRPANLRQSPRQ